MSAPTSELVYTFVCRFIEANHLSPSIREIAEGCYINVATVIRYLDKLEAQERLYRTPGKARSICLLEPDQVMPTPQSR